ncbi:ArnT family glycosyltransferase [Mucilaginibacter gracilis]|nr:glycosyltransferase family 39 protein [Mucilaginibacter gracilis]
MKCTIYKVIKNLNTVDRILLSIVSILLLLIFAQGVLYPPNNWDSMTYHMARITSWISHGSVEHYPTHIFRQLYQPPFAEYVIMHVGILNGSDFFSNSVQFFFLLFSILSVILILDNFGLGRQYKIIAIVAIVTIPEVILQASSTQNDIVVSFFIITGFYFSVKALKNGNFADFVFWGLALGLGTLTKGTAYLYFFPVIIWFGIATVVRFLKSRNYRYLVYPLVTVLIFIAINGGHYQRNYKLTGNLLGIDKKESKSYSNQKMNTVLFFSNVIKNAGLHLGFMYVNDVAFFSNKIIYKLHAMAGLNINDPLVNYRNTTFSTENPATNEDCAPNMVHFIFILVSFGILLMQVIKRRNLLSLHLLIVIVLQVMLFCLYLKWQPWHSRLHSCFFLMAIPLLCYACNLSSRFKKALYIVFPILISYAFLVVLHNSNRPYESSLFVCRYQKYFIGRPSAFKEYSEIHQIIEKGNNTNIGLIVGEDDWEYPLFNNCFNRTINPIYINVNNMSRNLPQSSYLLDCIVSTDINSPFIDFKGKRFYNQSSKNKIIYLYTQSPLPIKI